MYKERMKFKSNAFAFMMTLMLMRISAIFKNTQSTYDRYSFIGNIIIVRMNIKENIGVRTNEYNGPNNENSPLIIIVSGRFIK